MSTFSQKWKSFYSEQEAVAFEAKNTSLSQATLANMKSWENCIRNQAKRGIPVRDARCMVDERPSRKDLDNLSGEDFHVVAHHQAGWYDKPDNEWVPSTWTLQFSRPGIRGLWDQFWDDSQI